jgi:hypothetical protein
MAFHCIAQGGRLVSALLNVSFLKDFTVANDADDTDPMGCLWYGAQ